MTASTRPLFREQTASGSGAFRRVGRRLDGVDAPALTVRRPRRCDFQRTGQISDDVLWKRLVNQVPDGCRLTSVMDCCHSGTGLDLPYCYMQGKGWSVDSLPAFSPGDVQLFSGCRDDQTSADVVSGGQAGGAMTNAFWPFWTMRDKTSSTTN